MIQFCYSEYQWVPESDLWFCNSSFRLVSLYKEGFPTGGNDIFSSCPWRSPFNVNNILVVAQFVFTLDHPGSQQKAGNVQPSYLELVTIYNS